MHKIPKNKIKQNKTISNLIDSFSMDLEELLDDDGDTLHYFSVTYNVAVKSNDNIQYKEKVVQYSLYRLIDTNLRATLQKKLPKLDIDIEYNTNNVGEYKILYEGKIYDVLSPSECDEDFA